MTSEAATWTPGGFAGTSIDRAGERTLTISSALGTLRRRWRVLSVFIVLCVGASAAYLSLSAPQYSSTTSLFFSLDDGQTANELVQGSNYTQELVQSYTRVATSPVVLTPVVDELGLQTTAQALAPSITVQAPLNTVLMDITVTRPSASEAAAIAASTADHLRTALASLSPRGPAESSLTVTVIQPATVPRSPSAPRPVLTLAVGLLLGILAGGTAVLVREVVGGTLIDQESVSRVTSTPVIGLIPGIRRRTPRGNSRLWRHTDARAEAYRALRTNLEFLSRGGTKSLVITSAQENEGKTTTAVGLATVLAETGHRVLLIDADLRRPAVAAALGLEGAVGLSTALSGRVAWTDVVQSWGPHSIAVLAAGAIPPNPSELLASARMAELLRAAAATYDAVILDSAPLLPVTDAAVLAGRTDGALLVVNARRTPPRRLAEALGRVRLAGAPVLGVVLNFVRPLRSAYYDGPQGR